MKLPLDKVKDVILILMTIITIFFLINYLLTPSGYKQQLRDSDKRIKLLQSKRDSLDRANKLLSEKIKLDSINVLQSKRTVDSLNILIRNRDAKIKDLAHKVNISKREADETKRRIDNLTKNPIKRTGDALLNSLKEKSSKK